MATFVSYDANANKEGLMDLLKIVDVKKTPFISSLKQYKIDSVKPEWVTDDLAAADATNALVEGADYTYRSLSGRTRVENYTQIFSKAWQVSNTQDAVSKAGVKSEWAYRMDKAMKEIKRDMEKAFFQGTVSAGTSSAARTTKGAEAFITTNANTVSTALSEDDYNDLLQSIAVAGGNPDETYVNAFQKRKISAFSTPNTRNINAEDGKVTTRVDVYESDFGMQEIIFDNFVSTDTVLVLEKGLWGMGVLRPLAEDPELAKTGDSRKGALVGEVALLALNEKGSGKITGLTTS